MAPADSTFTITIDGRPIAPVDEHAVDRTQAKLGSGAAVFSLKNDRLYSGDWILGRATRENRSFLPKQVLWFKVGEGAENQVQPVKVEENGGTLRVSFGNARLTSQEDHVFASHGGEEEDKYVTVEMK